MKLIFLSTLVFFFLIGCNGGNKKVNEVPKIGDSKIVGIYIKRDGTKVLDILFRRISKTIKTDSITKKDVIVIDTLYGMPIVIKAVDSVGNILKTRDGKDSINPQPVYVPITKDSINTFVSNIPIDSLLRKN